MVSSDQPTTASGLPTDSASVEGWIEKAYAKLYGIAANRMGHENPGQTLSATSLINEVFIRLHRSTQIKFENESHFLATASIEMSRVLIDVARRKKAVKHGGDCKRQELNGGIAEAAASSAILDVHEAIDALDVEDPQKATLVRMRYILGLSEEETAAALNISRATASRHWKFARAWLINYLS